jgi:hypothetical protein
MQRRLPDLFALTSDSEREIQRAAYGPEEWVMQEHIMIVPPVFFEAEN